MSGWGEGSEGGNQTSRLRQTGRASRAGVAADELVGFLVHHAVRAGGEADVAGEFVDFYGREWGIS